VLFIHEYLEQNPDLLKYYKRTVVPDESLIQSVLINSQKFNLCNESKRYADTYERIDGHARALDLADYETLISSDFHFARKFDLNTNSAILDKLDKFLLENQQ
jgi:ubiquinone biosynthesis protein COQ9